MRKPTIIFLGVILVSVFVAAGCKKSKEEPKPATPGSATAVAPQAAPLANTGPGSSGCTDLRGDYEVIQIVNFLGCTTDGKQVAIPDWKDALPEKSKLTVVQSGCTVEATENIGSLKLKILHTGKSSKDGTLSVNVKNPADLSLPLKMTINNRYLTCTYKGGLNWAGKLESKGLIKGNVKYSLSLAGAITTCPQTCGMITEFTATGD